MLVARHKTILMGLTRSLSTLTGSDPTFSIDELAKKKKKYPTDKAIVGWDSHGRIPPREAHPILLGDCCYQLCVKKNMAVRQGITNHFLALCIMYHHGMRHGLAVAEFCVFVLLVPHVCAHIYVCISMSYRVYMICGICEATQLHQYARFPWVKVRKRLPETLGLHFFFWSHYSWNAKLWDKVARCLCFFPRSNVLKGCWWESVILGSQDQSFHPGMFQPINVSFHWDHWAPHLRRKTMLSSSLVAGSFCRTPTWELAAWILCQVNVSTYTRMHGPFACQSSISKKTMCC